MTAIPKRYHRKRSVAQRYGAKSRRWVERAVERKILPPPDLYMGPIPLWSEESLDAADREAMQRGQQAIARDARVKTATTR